MRNLAYHRGWNAAKLERKQQEFWRTINGNFIDTAVLEWCKVYGDQRAKHHWEKCVSDTANFAEGLWQITGKTEEEFEQYRVVVRAYRDKFVAHLDELNQMQIPDLQPALESIRYLYQHLVDVEDDVDAFVDLPPNANRYYQTHLTEGKAAHRE
ncbi:hypothetical protein [Pelomonas cellulosilytica]|uniref:Uncharacterized protein n=1 Tax=Pelomonas cellulosilytica TaxID=2906762 RepID=A0ABS8Y030_9BURK|nr:hypothetical protein [Pelomonas sp. P8]MCE4556288.1 hypothetical protein [Pelomonas sp. P8]